MTATYPTKISLAILDALAAWEKLNVAAFLASAVAIARPETHGEAFRDASGTLYLPFIRQPMLVYAAKSPEALSKAYGRARREGLEVGIYSRGLLATRSEEENHAVIGSTAEGEHELIGLVVYGPSPRVDRAFKRLRLHA